MRSRSLVSFSAVLALVVGCATGCASETDDAATDSDEVVTANEQAIIALGAASQHSLYVRLSTKPSKELTAALIDAAKRGVDTHALLPGTGSFDSTWMLQQHLESSGVDVDVRNDKPLENVLVVADDNAALVPAKTGTATKKVSGADASALAKHFADVLGAATAAPGALAAANTVTVHPMPESSRDRIVAVLGAAKRSIDLEIYQLQDRVVVKALAAAAARHVKVRVMLEPRTVGAENYKAVSKELAAAGVTVQVTPPAFDSSHNVDHAKFAVIDGAELIFGTGNLVRSGLGGVTEQTFDNRDFWVEDSRAASVKAGAALFDADWNRRATKAADFDGFVLTPDNANDKIEALIAVAKHTVLVYNQSLGDDDLVAALIAAKKRGATVRVLLGYQPGFGGAPPQNQAPIDKLVAAGVEASFLKKHYLHAKAIVADGRVYIGSQNFTNGGLRNNRELGQIFDDRAAVAKVTASFEADAR
jgi:phosphatidylserine/phosphatidylglycerophosphate/cardiolipin synthase-like enzyme